MSRVLSILLVGAIAVVGLFPGWIAPTIAPTPYCGRTRSFQSTFALADSEIVFLADDVSEADAKRIGAAAPFAEFLGFILLPTLPAIGATVGHNR